MGSEMCIRDSSHAAGILEGCQQRANASKASLFPCPTKDQLAKALAPMLGAGSGERLTGGQPSGLDCEYAIRTQPCRMNLKSLMQPGPRVSALGLLSGFGCLSILGLQSYSSSDLINTPLQQGVVRTRDGRKPFQRFPGLRGRNGPFDDPLYRRPGGAPSLGGAMRAPLASGMKPLKRFQCRPRRLPPR